MDTRSAAACGRSERRTPPSVPKAAAPWLVFPYGEGMKSQAFYNMCDPDNKTCRKSIPELRGKSFWQKTSHGNWLVILCDDKSYESIYNSDNWNHGDCFLWNPVSLDNIQLPSLVEWISIPEKYVLVDCVLTSPPASRHPQKEDSMVVFLFSTSFDNKDIVLLLFCHPGDKQWRIHRISLGDIPDVDLEEDLFSLHSFKGYVVNLGWELVSIHYFKGKLYVAFGRDDRLLEIEKEHLLDNAKTLSIIRPLELVNSNTKLVPLGVDYTDLYYAESDVEFFRILVSYNVGCKQVMSIYVWRLDFSSMKWEEMNDSRDRVIFAGVNTGFCFSAAELSLKSGGLYYALPECDDQSLYKFQLNGGNTVSLPCLNLQTPWFRPEWIMMMPEDGMENNDKEQQQHFTLKEIEENKIFTTSYIDRSHDKQSEEEINPWGTLIEDALAEISTYLYPLDYVHFRSVCKENRRVMPPTTQKQGSNSTGCPHISPWLMFPRDDTYSFVDPVNDNETYLMSFCELVQGATIRYQKDGWILMSRMRNILFYNPFTRQIIQLPDLPVGYSISIICFVDSPTTSDCVVFAIDQTDFATYVLTIRRGQDHWDVDEFPNTDDKKLMLLHGTAPIYKEQTFYCVDCDGTLGAYDFMKDDGWSILARPTKIFNNDLHPNLLVECGGDLLLVKIGHFGTTVRIFRLVLSAMEWVKVESLGKYMLFISETSCLSAIATNSQMENVICFPRVYSNGDGILLYSLETGSYHSSSGKNQNSFNSFYETEGWLSNCTWIQPNWCKSTEQELDWLNALR